MKKLTFDEINDFVVTNATDDRTVYDSDLKLYKKLYPASRIIPDLETASQYNLKKLDGRMIIEILKVVCIETVLENRGIVHDFSKKNDADPGMNYDALNELMNADLETIKYAKMKSIVLRLGITTGNAKADTYKSALKQYLQGLKPGSSDVKTEPVIDTEKKSGDQE